MPAGWKSSIRLPEGSSRRICDRPVRDDVVAEPHAGGPEPLDLAVDVVDDEVDPVPASRSRGAAVGHGPPRRARRATEEQPQVAAGDVGERGRGVEPT